MIRLKKFTLKTVMVEKNFCTGSRRAREKKRKKEKREKGKKGREKEREKKSRESEKGKKSRKEGATQKVVTSCNVK